MNDDDRAWALEVETESWGAPLVARRGELVDPTALGHGIARALLDAVRDAARAAGCRGLWLITTNNNLRALDLYQRWGMDLVALHRHAVAESRKLKPSIPERDGRVIPIAHELELELLL
jgi:GNAT superfamily N-acetyltransferase